VPGKFVKGPDPNPLSVMVQNRDFADYLMKRGIDWGALRKVLRSGLLKIPNHKVFAPSNIKALDYAIRNLTALSRNPWIVGDNSEEIREIKERIDAIRSDLKIKQDLFPKQKKGKCRGNVLGKKFVKNEMSHYGISPNLTTANYRIGRAIAELLDVIERVLPPPDSRPWTQRHECSLIAEILNNAMRVRPHWLPIFTEHTVKELYDNYLQKKGGCS